MERRFLVTWEMDIFAASPREAAEKALAVHRKPTSVATVFDVQEHGRQETVRIDLEEIEESKES